MSISDHYCGIAISMSCDVVTCDNRFYDAAEGIELIEAACRNGWTVDQSCGIDTHLCPEHSIQVSNTTEVMQQTAEHIKRVGQCMSAACSNLMQRAVEHDQSKYGVEEFPAFARVTPKLKGLTYGSAEYKKSLEELGPALKHHYENNQHHPEHHVNGFWDMSLLDWIEMLCDWKAATERHANGDLLDSIEQNSKRFGFDDKMVAVLKRTAMELGFILKPGNNEQT